MQIRLKHPRASSLAPKIASRSCWRWSAKLQRSAAPWHERTNCNPAKGCAILLLQNAKVRRRVCKVSRAVPCRAVPCRASGRGTSGPLDLWGTGGNVAVAAGSEAEGGRP